MVKFSDGTTLENGVVFGGMRTVRGASRETLEITIKGSSYEQLAQLFCDGAAFTLITDAQQVEDEEFDKSEYCVAGDITDKRDGTFVVFMGCKTPTEILEEQNAQLLMDMMGGINIEA